MKSIGILGTAKNTGKTTATGVIISELVARGIALGLTSIGYDGEETDNITGLPKPRLHCPKGLVIATARQCVQASEAALEIIAETSLPTPLGEILLVRVINPGLVVLAGPNQGRHLKSALAQMEKLGLSLTLVDGALGRAYPLIKTDRVILATGAARSTEPVAVAEEAGVMIKTFSLTKAVLPINAEDLPAYTCWVAGKDNTAKSLTSLSFNKDQDRKYLLGSLDNTVNSVYLTGVYSEHALFNFIQECEQKQWKGEIIFPSPVNLLISLPWERLADLLEKAASASIKLRVETSLNVLAVTSNPFYPCKDPGAPTGFRAEEIDGKELKRTLVSQCPVPVVDVKADGIDCITEKLNEYISGKPA